MLVGDTLGMVVQGHGSTLPVTARRDDLSRPRRRSAGVTRAHVVVDLPFMSYQVSVEDGLRAAGRVLKEGGAEAVKLEGGEEVAPLVARLVAAGIPVMGHVGLTPQSVHQFGGFKVQGRTEASGQRSWPAPRRWPRPAPTPSCSRGCPPRWPPRSPPAVPVPTIGIGAGPGCDGQVLVMHDVLGLDPGWSPRFVRRYAELGKEIERAFAAYAADVRGRALPRRRRVLSLSDRPSTPTVIGRPRRP